MFELFLQFFTFERLSNHHQIAQPTNLSFPHYLCMTNIDSSSPLQFESTEPVLSEPRNTEAIVEVTRELQRLRIVNLGALSLKKDMTNERIPL